MNWLEETGSWHMISSPGHMSFTILYLLLIVVILVLIISASGK